MLAEDELGIRRLYVGLYKPPLSVHSTRWHLAIIRIPQYNCPPTIVIMDALKAEIALKRKTLESDISSRPTKYLRRADIERIKQEEEQKAKQEKARLAQEEARKKVEVITEQVKPDANASILSRVVSICHLQ